MRLLATTLFALCITLAGNAQAQTPGFIFPLDCTLGENCWTVNYLDVDPSDNSAKDFRCGEKTYKGHKGTDFAVRSMTEVRSGVNILAARDGKILRVRDGEPDGPKTDAQFDAIKSANKECGNAVLIDHSNSLTSIYCHLKQKSISVQPGQNVQAGDVIGQVGYSGMAEFPHLHFGITWEGSIMDPYTGLTSENGCGKHKKSMWLNSAMEYQPAAIYDAGFTTDPPDFKAIDMGATNPKKIGPEANALVFWAAFYGVEKGDLVTMEIITPDGLRFIKREITQDKARARQYYYTGRSLNNRTLESGEYKGIAKISRGDWNKTISRTVRYVP